MPTIEIENLPPDVYRTLSRRARAAGQSLEAYILERLVAYGRGASLEEALKIGSREKGGRVSLADATRQVREDRDR